MSAHKVIVVARATNPAQFCVAIARIRARSPRICVAFHFSAVRTGDPDENGTHGERPVALSGPASPVMEMAHCRTETALAHFPPSFAPSLPTPDSHPSAYPEQRLL